LGETLVAVAPAAAAMASAVLSYLMTETIKAAQEESVEAVKKKIKALFNPEQKDDKPEKKEDKSLPPLTKEQMEQVKKLARKQAIQFGIKPDKADKMASALIGSLALRRYHGYRRNRNEGSCSKALESVCIPSETNVRFTLLIIAALMLALYSAETIASVTGLIVYTDTPASADLLDPASIERNWLKASMY